MYVIAYCFSYNGILFNGLDSNQGVIVPGEEFTHKIVAANLNISPVVLNVIPTCGCAEDKFEKYELHPFSVVTMKVRYRIISRQKGAQVRLLLLVYRVSGITRKVIGRIDFELS
jgi:tRNA U34 5-carboxymethylaminomethyl modifying enzyme MnmG/GidA